MTNSVFCYKDHAKDSIVTATNEESNFPVTNIRTLDFTEVGRFTGASTVISLSFTSSIDFRIISLSSIGDSGFSGFTTFEIDAGGGNTFDSGSLGSGQVYSEDSLYRQAYADFGQTVSTTSIDITLTASVNSYLEIGRLYVGEEAPITLAPTYPLTLGREYRTRRVQTLRGQQYFFPRLSPRRKTVEYDLVLNRPELINQFERRIDLAGVTGDQLFWVEDVDDPDVKRDAMLCTLVSSSSRIPSFGRNRKRIELREVGGVVSPTVL